MSLNQPSIITSQSHLIYLSFTPSLVIDSIQIRQDAAGRYCLNDLHKAAGGVKKDGPSYFMAAEQTQALLDEVEAHSETTGIPVFTVYGRNGGTYVCKELVYAYAMWISAAFNLKVIRAYDAMVQIWTM